MPIYRPNGTVTVATPVSEHSLLPPLPLETSSLQYQQTLFERGIGRLLFAGVGIPMAMLAVGAFALFTIYCDPSLGLGWLVVGLIPWYVAIYLRLKNIGNPVWRSVVLTVLSASGCLLIVGLCCILLPPGWCQKAQFSHGYRAAWLIGVAALAGALMALALRI